MALAAINYDLCIICQMKTKDPLRCPLESKQDYEPYDPFLERVQHMTRHSLLDTRHQHLVELTGDELRRNKAKWHSKCTVKFSVSRIQRTEERARASVAPITPNVCVAMAISFFDFPGSVIIRQSVCFYLMSPEIIQNSGQ